MSGDSRKSKEVQDLPKLLADQSLLMLVNIMNRILPHSSNANDIN